MDVGLRLGGIVLILSFVFSSADAGVGASRDYRQVQAFLRRTAAANPQNAQVFSIGKSGTGDDIEGLKIGTGPVKHLIVATHHGNEYGSTEVAVGAAEEFARNPVPGVAVYVVPVLNISGFNIRRREETLSGSRTADPNRDYPSPCGSEGPFLVKSTKALADFVESEGIVAAATLHTNYPVVAYPWGFATRDLKTAYEQLFIDLSKLTVVESRYPVGNSAQAIYPANGTFEDYVFWKHGVWSLLFELGYTHNPGENEVREMVRVNVPGLRNMMAAAPTVRATDHAFNGKCDPSLRALDRHDE